MGGSGYSRGRQEIGQSTLQYRRWLRVPTARRKRGMQQGGQSRAQLAPSSRPSASRAYDAGRRYGPPRECRDEAVTSPLTSRSHPLDSARLPKICHPQHRRHRQGEYPPRHRHYARTGSGTVCRHVGKGLGRSRRREGAGWVGGVMDDAGAGDRWPTWGPGSDTTTVAQAQRVVEAPLTTTRTARLAERPSRDCVRVVLIRSLTLDFIADQDQHQWPPRRLRRVRRRRRVS